MTKRVILLIVGTVVGLSLILGACSSQRTTLEKIKSSGELHVLTRNSPTTYFEGPHGPAGLEYELVKRFADSLGVELKLKTPDTLADILDDVRSGNAHLAAAGLTITDERRQWVRFGPAYQRIAEQLVYKRGTRRPRTLRETMKGHLEVVANSSHAERLAALRSEVDGLTWYETADGDTTDLLDLVAEDIIDYTVADSNEVAVTRRYYPTLNVAFDISEPQPLAWAFPRSEDSSLYEAAETFFNGLIASGELDRLIERYYGHINKYDYAGTHIYLRHVNRRLPAYRELFEQAANEHDLDWRLLAAVAYQESHWNSRAVSPTGVRGIMMLTQATAAHIGIQKRTDPEQSIAGGALYLRRLLDKIPEHIPEPDRTWFALAAYNVGYGHLQDAQEITRQRGGDADKWTDVKENLPLLRLRKWYSKTRHGYARGNEPVRYVENIRSYYDILSWHLDRRFPPDAPNPVLSISPSVL